MNGKILSIGFVLLLAFAVPANADVFTSGVAGDAGVSEKSWEADSNFGSHYSIWTGLAANDGKHNRLFIKVDLPDLGSQTASDITSAVITVYRRPYADLVYKDDYAKVYRMITPWAESEVTWNKPTTSGSWGQAGGLAGTDWDATPVFTSTDLALSSPVGYYDLDITQTVKDWYNGVYTNEGLMVYAEVQGTLSLASRDNSDSALRPVFTVTTIPEPATVSLLLSGGLVGLIKCRNRK